MHDTSMHSGQPRLLNANGVRPSDRTDDTVRTPKSPPSRRRFLALACGSAAGVALASCSPTTSPSAVPKAPGTGGGASPAKEQVQLVYQDWRTEWFPPMARDMLEQFHESHPDIHVFFTLDPENLEAKMLSDMQAGTAPDIFAGCCSFFPIWAQKGSLTAGAA